jgi:hypothetical protein
MREVQAKKQRTLIYNQPNILLVVMGEIQPKKQRTLIYNQPNILLVVMACTNSVKNI